MRLLTEFHKSIADATRAGEIIEQDAKSLADTMKAVHGGEWRIQIDHEVGFVLVVRR